MDSTHYKLIATVILALVFITLLILERVFPLRKATRAFAPRAIINFSFMLLVYSTAFVLVSPTAEWIQKLSNTRQIGLLQYFQFTGITTFLLGFILMDLSFYYWHRLNHQWSLLWRFHNVHHCDPDLDVTTSMRFHFVEIGYSSLFRILQIAIIGPNLITFLSYELMFQANTFFHHSNLKLPIRLERMINKILVTPRMHGIHHSNYMSETNSNYSVVLSIWDWLHHTIRLNIPQNNIQIGVPAYHEVNDNRFLNLIRMPFTRQRFYWKHNSNNFIKRETDFESGKSSMLE